MTARILRNKISIFYGFFNVRGNKYYLHSSTKEERVPAVFSN